ncbi:MAG: hypothetical protein N2491_09085 [Negativicutes bacterium]|nr:hypothetical protein [Negativicutes bacterium]
MIIAFISLLFGLIIGYTAQRSRMCFIGGMRDYMLVQDSQLLKGLLAFLGAATVFYYLASIAGGDLYGYPWFEREQRKSLELARDYHAFAACWIPDEVVIAAYNATKVKGFALPGGWLLSYTALTTVAAGLGIGYLSTVANGCPLRQHVLAASGNRGAYMYLAGFYLGAIVFNYLIAPVFQRLIS